MASKYILTIHEGEIVKRVLRKPQAPRSTETWQRAAVRVAKAWVRIAGWYAFRLRDQWHIYTTSDPLKPVKSFETEDAAAMYMLYRAPR